MTQIKVVGGVLGVMVLVVIFYFGFIGYLPEPTQVRTDITAAIVNR